MVPPPIELTRENDISDLDAALQASYSEAETASNLRCLPLRHQLWYIRAKVISQGRVYVDEWPKFKHVCCLNESSEFLLTQNNNNNNNSNDNNFNKKRYDFDLVTFYETNESCERSLAEFLESMAAIRGWNAAAGRGLYGNFVRASIVDTFRRVLGGGRCSDDDDEGGTSSTYNFELYGTLYLNTGLERGNSEAYRRRHAQLASALPDEGLIAGTVRQSDADRVVHNWPYAPDGVTGDYFRWLIRSFPSVALRRADDDQLIAWACCYSCGGIANLFIDQRYRGRGLAEYMWLSIALKVADFTPVQPYFSIAPGNTASEKSAAKTFHLDHKKDEVLTTWLFFQSQGHK